MNNPKQLETKKSIRKKVLIPGQMNLLTEDLEDDRTPVEIEPEIIKVAEHKRERKAKATHEVMFANLPVRQVKVDTLSE